MCFSYLKRRLEVDARGGYCKGSKSQSSTNTTTTTVDKRMVVDGGSLGVTADGSTITVNALDAGIVEKALDTVKASDATNGEGFSQLLDLASNLFDKGGALIEKTQDATLAQIDSINAAANDKQGAIDQKTMIVLAVAGATAAAAIWGEK